MKVERFKLDVQIFWVMIEGLLCYILNYSQLLQFAKFRIDMTIIEVQAILNVENFCVLKTRVTKSVSGRAFEKKTESKRMKDNTVNKKS